MNRNALLTRFLFGTILSTCCFLTNAQNTIGIPAVVNYPKLTYNAGSQNWGIAQDKNGIIYFANNQGLLSFDGTFWRKYPLPNKTIVRSVAVDKNNRIYIGGVTINMYSQYSLSTFSNRRLNFCWVNAKGVSINIHKHRLAMFPQNMYAVVAMH